MILETLDNAKLALGITNPARDAEVRCISSTRAR